MIGQITHKVESLKSKKVKEESDAVDKHRQSLVEAEQEEEEAAALRLCHTMCHGQCVLSCMTPCPMLNMCFCV